MNLVLTYVHGIFFVDNYAGDTYLHIRSRSAGRFSFTGVVRFAYCNKKRTHTADRRSSHRLPLFSASPNLSISLSCLSLGELASTPTNYRTLPRKSAPTFHLQQQDVNYVVLTLLFFCGITDGKYIARREERVLFRPWTKLLCLEPRPV